MGMKIKEAILTLNANVVIACERAGFSSATVKMIEDALDTIENALKEQEPRVMTLDELTEIYVEFKNDDCPIRLNNFDLQKIIMYAADGDCRIWTGKPTDEQRKTVKWG